MAQLGVATLDKDWAIACESRLDLSHACCPECRDTYVLVSNWLFVETPRGARASATIYSLIETAKANEIEPYEYLLHVLKHIASADTLEKLEALLPWNMKAVIKQRC